MDLIFSFRAVRHSLLFMLFTAVITSSACSSRNAYEALKTRERILCNQVPPAEYEDCIKQSEGNYDDYRRQREEIKSEQDKTKTP